MSAEAVSKFLEQIPTDPKLADEIRSVIAEREEQAAFELVEMAAGLGLEFTATELRNQLAGMQGEGGELNEAELEAVAGGVLSSTGLISLRSLLVRDNPFGGGIRIDTKRIDITKP